jgi:hypothetical protein
MTGPFLLLLGLAGRLVYLRRLTHHLLMLVNPVCVCVHELPTSGSPSFCSHPQTGATSAMKKNEIWYSYGTPLEGEQVFARGLGPISPDGNRSNACTTLPEWCGTSPLVS